MRQFTSTIESMVSAYMHEYYPDDASVAADLHLRSFVAAFPPHYHERISKDGVFTKQHVVDLLATVITYVTGFHNHLGNIAVTTSAPTPLFSEIHEARLESLLLVAARCSGLRSITSVCLA